MYDDLKPEDVENILGLAFCAAPTLVIVAYCVLGVLRSMISRSGTGEGKAAAWTRAVDKNTDFRFRR